MTYKTALAQHPPPIVSYANRTVDFNYPDGPYTNTMLDHDFGNGVYPVDRGFAEIKDSTYKITFKKGQKSAKLVRLFS